MIELVDLQGFTDLLTLGGVGFVGGVILPFAFRIVGYVVDVVRVVLR